MRNAKSRSVGCGQCTRAVQLCANKTNMTPPKMCYRGTGGSERDAGRKRAAMNVCAIGLPSARHSSRGSTAYVYSEREQVQ
jgi:hypothetical protein